MKTRRRGTGAPGRQVRGGVCRFLCVSIAAAAMLVLPDRAAADAETAERLTGDWGGARTRIEQSGIAFNLTYTFEVLANLRGGIRRGIVGNGLIQPQLDFDLEKLLGMSGAKFRAGAIVTHGPGLTAGYVGNFMPVSSIEAGPVARLFELWYEQAIPGEHASFRVGLMTADAEFATSDTASTFMNNTFGWNTLFGLALPAGGPAYPIPAPGARLRVKPAADIYVQAAIFSGDPSGRDGSNPSPFPLPTGTVFSFSGGAFLLAEAGYTPNQGKGAGGLPGAFKLGAWYHTGRRFADQHFDATGLSLADPASSGEPFNYRGNWAVYAVAEQMLFRVPGTEDQGLSAFTRVTAAPSDRNLVQFYADGGLVYTGLLPGRSEDKIGVSAAYARVSGRGRDLDRDTAFFTGGFYPIRSFDALIEATYKAKLRPWWTLQGDVQYVIRPSGGVLNDDGTLRRNAVVVGLRSAVNF